MTDPDQTPCPVCTHPATVHHPAGGCQAGTLSDPCGCALSGEGVMQDAGAAVRPATPYRPDVPKLRALLAETPDLAAEVEATRDHPNPGAKAARGAPTSGPRPPTDIATLYALLPDGDADYEGRGLRGVLAMCCRLVIEEMADVLPTADIPPWPSDTWAGICGWLDTTLDWWTTTPWAADIDSDIRAVHDELRELARVRREPVYLCPKCGDVMRLQDGGQWLRCDSGHDEPADLEARYRRRPMAPSSALADEFGITQGLIRLWKHRGKLTSTEIRDGELWAYPWDILLLSNPAIAEAVATREALRTRSSS